MKQFSFMSPNRRESAIFRSISGMAAGTSTPMSIFSPSGNRAKNRSAASRSATLSPSPGPGTMSLKSTKDSSAKIRLSTSLKGDCSRVRSPRQSR